MAFLSAQVILGTEEVQCPGRILFSFVWDLLHDNPDQWEELKSNQTVMRAFVCLLDVLERNLYTPLNLNSKKAVFIALNQRQKFEKLLFKFMASKDRYSYAEINYYRRVTKPTFPPKWVVQFSIFLKYSIFT